MLAQPSFTESTVTVSPGLSLPATSLLVLGWLRTLTFTDASTVAMVISSVTVSTAKSSPAVCWICSSR